VLLLGDSVTWGAGVREEDTFARKLEAALAAELACPVEVVNAGVSGYGTVEELDVLAHEGLGFEPDAVVVYYVENDNQSVAHLQGGLASFVKDHLVYRSYLVGATLYAWRNAAWRVEAARAGGAEQAYRASQAAWDARPGTQASLDALRGIAAIGRERDIAILLASHPNSIQDPSADARRNELLRETARAEGIAFVDVGPALLAHADRDLAVSKRDLHPNGFAHGLIATALRPAVRDALDCPARDAETP
jgi:lysophospholipase L1-like esterase